MALPMQIPRGEMIAPFEQMRQEFGSMLSRFGWPWPMRAFRGDLMDPFEQMRQTFASLFGSLAVPGREVETLLSPYGVDIRQDTDHIYVEADLPGFNKDDLDVRIENQTLTISGEHKEEKKEEKKDYLLHERAQRTFSRSFTLPASVDEKSVDAKFDNGVLNITLNKKDETAAHKVLVH